MRDRQYEKDREDDRKDAAKESLDGWIIDWVENILSVSPEVIGEMDCLKYDEPDLLERIVKVIKRDYLRGKK